MRGFNSPSSAIWPREVWKTKEAKTKTEDAPALGDAKKRGILMEAVTAVMLLLAGADVLVMRHPEAIKLVREMIADFMANRLKKGEENIKEDKMSDLEKKSIDPATIKMLKKAQADGCETIFDRAETMKPCPIGAEGSCCKNCAMGPCRVPAPKKKGETAAEKAKRMGLCGATAETISARNFARMVAAGTAAHSDHARGIAEVFLATAKGDVPGFQIKDEQKLYQVAMDFGVEIGDRSVKEIAIDVGHKAVAEFGRQEGEPLFIKRAPLKRQEIWRKLGITPRGIDREVVELMHRTHMGVDQDYRSLLMAAARCALADGWAGSMISTELQDILFGNPVPVYGQINLGVLKKDEVNVVVHGHEPLTP